MPTITPVTIYFVSDRPLTPWERRAARAHVARAANMTIDVPRSIGRFRTMFFSSRRDGDEALAHSLVELADLGVPK